MFRAMFCSLLIISSWGVFCSERAVLGNSSRGSGATASPEVNYMFERAMKMAREDCSEISVEYLLHALLDDDSSQDFLNQAQVDTNQLRMTLEQYLSQKTSAVEGADLATLRMVMGESHTWKTQQDKKFSTGDDVILAILMEGHSFAATALESSGLDATEALKIADQRLAAQMAEQATDLKRLERKNSKISLVEVLIPLDSYVLSQSEQQGPKQYLMRVMAESDDNPVLFKGAISRDGILDLLIEETPFEIEFTADRLAVLLDAVDSSQLTAELYIRTDQGLLKTGGFGGNSGAFFEDRYSSVQRSGFID